MEATATQTSAIVERFTLKAFIEACLVLEEGVSSLREIETGMMMGAGILPGPFARADDRGPTRTSTRRRRCCSRPAATSRSSG